MSLANISIVGNLVKPPEQMHFSSGRVKTTLVVAVNTFGRPNRGGDAADFYKVDGQNEGESQDTKTSGNVITGTLPCPEVPDVDDPFVGEEVSLDDDDSSSGISDAADGDTSKKTRSKPLATKSA